MSVHREAGSTQAWQHKTPLLYYFTLNLSPFPFGCQQLLWEAWEASLRFCWLAVSIPSFLPLNIGISRLKSWAQRENSPHWDHSHESLQLRSFPKFPVIQGGKGNGSGTIDVHQQMLFPPVGWEYISGFNFNTKTTKKSSPGIHLAFASAPPATPTPPPCTSRVIPGVIGNDNAEINMHMLSICHRSMLHLGSI